MDLTPRDYDEVDLVLIPAAEALNKFHVMMASYGLSRRQMLAVLRERLPIARQIINDQDPSLH